MAVAKIAKTRSQHDEDVALLRADEAAIDARATHRGHGGQIVQPSRDRVDVHGIDRKEQDVGSSGLAHEA